MDKYLGGLCSIFRRQAGQMFEDGKTDEINCNKNEYCNNTHWLQGDSDKSKYVGYYDATSLYPSSGKENLIKTLVFFNIIKN